MAMKCKTPDYRLSGERKKKAAGQYQEEVDYERDLKHEYQRNAPDRI